MLELIPFIQYKTECRHLKNAYGTIAQKMLAFCMPPFANASNIMLAMHMCHIKMLPKWRCGML